MSVYLDKADRSQEDGSGPVALAPLHDTVPTITWPSLRTDAAMAANGRFSLVRADRHDLVAEAVAWPLDEQAAIDTITDTLERLRDAIPHVVQEDGALARTLAARVESLLAGATAGAPAHPYAERGR